MSGCEVKLCSQLLCFLLLIIGLFVFFNLVLLFIFLLLVIFSAVFPFILFFLLFPSFLFLLLFLLILLDFNRFLNHFLAFSMVNHLNSWVIMKLSHISGLILTRWTLVTGTLILNDTETFLLVWFYSLRVPLKLFFLEAWPKLAVELHHLIDLLMHRRVYTA